MVRVPCGSHKSSPTHSIVGKLSCDSLFVAGGGDPQAQTRPIDCTRRDSVIRLDRPDVRHGTREEARHVHEGDDGNVEGVAETHEASALHRGVDVQAAWGTHMNTHVKTLAALGY